MTTLPSQIIASAKQRAAAARAAYQANEERNKEIAMKRIARIQTIARKSEKTTDLHCPVCEQVTPHDGGQGELLEVFRCRLCGNEQIYRVSEK